MYINKVILAGFVGRDPEVRYLENENIMAKFSLATSERYKNKQGETITNTQWHTITAWRKLAQFAEDYVKKGALIYVEGKINTRNWQNKEGKQFYTANIIADKISLWRKPQNKEATQPGDHTEGDEAMSTETPEEADNLPF